MPLIATLWRNKNGITGKSKQNNTKLITILENETEGAVEQKQKFELSSKEEEEYLQYLIFFRSQTHCVYCLKSHEKIFQCRKCGNVRKSLFNFPDLSV